MVLCIKIYHFAYNEELNDDDDVDYQTIAWS